MSEFIINAEHQPPREVNRAIKKAAKDYDKITIKNPNAMHYIAAGLVDPIELVIDGSAGDGVGQGIYGGTVVVKRDVGSRTGEIMKNGTIIIGGNSGFMSGLFMMGGRIIILGDVSEDAGESIIRGAIYVKGSIKSLGKNAKIDELNTQDKEELKELLPNYGFNLKEEDYDSFKKIVPRSNRPFYGKESEEG